MKKQKKKDTGKIVQIGLRKLSVYKDYVNGTITVLEYDKEVYHGNPYGYHKWIREQKKILAISRTKSR